MTDEMENFNLNKKVKSLEVEIQYLKSLLDEAGIPYNQTEVLHENSMDSIAEINQQLKVQGSRIIPEIITAKHASYFYSFF